MSEWKPRVRSGLKWESLSLSAEEGFLLSRLDGATSVASLTHLTGLSAGQIEQTLHKLSANGAIDPPPPARAPTTTTSRPTVPAPRPAPRQAAKVTVEGAPLLSADASEEELDDAAAIRAALEDMSNDNLSLPALEGDETDEGDPVLDAGPDDAGPAVAAADGDDDELFADAPRDDEREPPPARADAAAGGDDAVGDEEADDKEGEDGEGEDEETAAVAEGNYRKLFETQLHDLPQEEREKMARVETGPTLLALCFDPVAQVIHGIFENPQVGFPHARLVARHHRTPQGIEAVFQRAEFPRDGLVQRYLLANPMLQDPHFKKLLQPKRLAVVYKWALSRDLPEKNRTKVRNLLRSKWGVSEGEERANLIFTTEGRVLQMLIGIPLDSMTVQQLCGRTIHSVMLVQNLARFASTPPLLLTHLLRQMVVKRQIHLRNMIFQHPNCPSSEKRKVQ